MPETNRTCLAIILAAGEGTRMRSARAKVLHEIAGRSMLEYVLDAVIQAGADRIAVVVGPDHREIAALVETRVSNARVFVQAERRGTAHAVLAAREALEAGVDDVVVAYADNPLVEPDTLLRLRDPLESGAVISVLGFEASDPTGYGRLIIEDDTLVAIREEKDASKEERAITLCNAGLMAFSGDRVLELLQEIGCNNAKGEFYLTDSVGVAVAHELPVAVIQAPEEEVQGANDRLQLSQAECVMQKRLRRRAMAGGATLVDSSSVTLSFDTVLGRDVVVEPHVVFGPGVIVGDAARIRSFSYLERCRVSPRASIGPHVHLADRP